MSTHKDEWAKETTRQSAFVPPLAVMAKDATLRDYFAAKAMQGLLACGAAHGENTASITAAGAYMLADAMLAERDK